MKKHPIILDVDTGFDDAFAVLFAALSPEVELLGITCVDGNTNVHQVVRNTLKVLDAANSAEIPVAIGATKPLVEEPLYAEHIHGKDGMGDLGLPESTRKIDPRSAIDLLRDLIEGSDEPVTLVPVAPLTNIANFITAYPEIANKLKSKEVLWASYEYGMIYPHEAKDIGDMTNEEVNQCILNAVPHFEYMTWN